MALIQSPSISTNGLIFYYDRFNRKKSWKGAPTTNIFATNLIATDSIRVINNNSYYGTYNGWTRTGVSNDNPRTVLFNGSISVASSTFYTLSCLYWSSNSILDDVYLKFSDTGWPESTFYIQPFSSQSQTRNGNFSVIDLGAGWKYCSGTFQTLSTTTTLEQLFFDVDVVDVQVFITNVQLEQQSFATPFVVGTRSNTQAILDLTNNNTITATSLTYASDGTFSFNGSSDYLSIPNTTLGNGNVEWTISCWMKTTTTTNDLGGGSILSNISGGPVYSMMGVNNGKIVYWTYQNSAWAQKLGVGKTVNDDNWHMLTWVNYSNYTMDMYVDGILDSNVANSTSGNNNPVDVIGRSWAGYFPGSIASLMRYTRALTRSEVLQNFNAQRSLYGV